MINVPGLRHYEATIRRGHYGLVEARAKLEILRELVNRVLETALVREKLDEFIEQRQALGATRREEAAEDARKKREEKERLKAESEDNGSLNGHPIESVANVSTNNNHSSQNGGTGKKQNGNIESCGQKESLARLVFIISLV